MTAARSGGMARKRTGLQVPAMPRITYIEDPESLPQLPVFEGLHLRDITAADWPDYGTEPWRFDVCKLDRCDLTGRAIARLKMWDCVAVRLDISAAQLFEAAILRSEFTGCRASGVQLGEATIKDVTFRQCKLNMLSFRSSHLERVVFEDCILDEADFAGARLKDVAFSGCSLQKTNFDKVECTNVDLSQSSISYIQGVMSLKGARIRAEQVMEIAPMLCAEVGLVLTD